MGAGDRINHEKILNNQYYQSLFLIEATDIHLYKNNSNKRRMEFLYKNIKYNLSVTCPSFDALCFETDFIKSKILCISLGENFLGDHYKIVAGIY